MKLLPNINKSVPEAADPALIKPVSDAIEALDTALGAKPSTLTTTAKTLVGAIKELKTKVDTLEANHSLLVPVNRYNDIIRNTGGTFINSFYDEYKAIKMLHFGFQFTRSSAETETILVTLPSDLRPAHTIYAPLMGVPATMKNSLCVITADGNVTAYCDPAQTIFRVNILLPYV